MNFKHPIPSGTTHRNVSDIYRWEQDNDTQLAIAERLEAVVTTLEVQCEFQYRLLEVLNNIEINLRNLISQGR